MTKEELRLDAWHRELAPSDSLRRWFAQDAKRWEEVVGRYQEELRTAEAYAGARDEQHNNAVVLRDEIERRSRRGKRRSAGGR